MLLVQLKERGGAGCQRAWHCQWAGRRERIRPERRQRGMKYLSQPPGLHARIVKCCKSLNSILAFASPTLAA